MPELAEHFHFKAISAGTAGRTEIEFAGLFFGKDDEFAHRFHRQGKVDDERVGTSTICVIAARSRVGRTVDVV